MDTLLSGKKGSGKSYYAAYKISELKDPDKVLHNVKGLKVGLNINEEAEKLGIRPIDFFRYSLHEDGVSGEGASPLHDERFLKYRGFLFVIDEATDYFPDNFKDLDVFKFFRMSRHYVIDVILITQFLDILCKKIYLHAELQLKAVPDISNPFPGYFLYHEMAVNDKGYGEKVGTQKLRKKKKVFESYHSADYDSAKPRKKPKPMQILFIGAVIISVFAFLGFTFFVKNRTSDNEKKQTFLQSSSSSPSLSTEKEIKPMYQSGNNHASQADTYPASMVDKLGGVFMPVSTFTNRKGLHVIILGIPYLAKNAPFPIHLSAFGHVALVPADIFEYQRQITSANKITNDYDPNQKYYYKDNASVASFIDKTTPDIP